MRNEDIGMTTRSTDGGGPFKISRELSPLQLASITGSILLFAVAVLAGAVRLSDSVDRLNKTVDKQSEQMATNNVVNAVQDRNIADIDRRVTRIETQIAPVRIVTK